MTQLLYGLAMVAVIVGVDVLFFRNHFWERLIVNVGIVMVFAAFYLRFLKPPMRRIIISRCSVAEVVSGGASGCCLASFTPASGGR